MVIVFVAIPVTNVTCCNTSLGPALNVVLAVPSEIVTTPAFVSLAILTIIDVPAGTVCCNVIVKVVLVPSTEAQLAADAAAPNAEIAPVAFAGTLPPIAERPFPTTGAPDVAIDVPLKVVLTTTAGTVIVEVPAPLKVVVIDAPPLILYVTIALGVPVKLKTALFPEQTGEVDVTAKVGGAAIVTEVVAVVIGQPPPAGIVYVTV
ncbi:hypothetical protein FCR2A7T_29800 [Flavobacterium cauense R2A-7]|nr:hypothetical protein FCR2A7T_29800 [Flavobacterium cauense R2A-7]